MKHQREINLLDVAKMLRRRLLMVAAIILTLMAGATVYVSRIPAQYTAGATVVLNSRSNKIADLQSLISKPLLGIPAADTSVLRTEIETISSPAMVQRVVEDTCTGIPASPPRSSAIGRFSFWGRSPSRGNTRTSPA
jgi:uncharacterized protein involved in exopolysaccharide biosynthesis